jgi:4-hydroxyproline epimerase
MSASSSVPRNHRIRVIESHTAGEPTRVVVAGGPDLGQGDLAERTERFRRDFDHYRSAIVNEPHGSDVMVGALLVEPTDPTCSAGVIFFNNVGYLGMCGHGTMGVMVSLKHMGRITSGLHRIETPVGVVTTTLSDDGSVTVDNVACHVAAGDLALELPGKTTVKGDIAWGGNWFFLTQAPDMALDLAHAQDLTDYAWRIRQAINAQGHPEVDHIELIGPARNGGDARNFVLCPGRVYDRSPCGTGTSAKLACLAARGQLREGEAWVQESVIGSVFTARYRRLDEKHILPSVTGQAYINAESTLIMDRADPYSWGIRA